MFKKCLPFMLACSLVMTSVSVPSVLAKSKAEKQAERAAKVKAGVAKLGVGPEARIAVKLRDQTKLSGYLSRVEADFFVVTDAKTGAAYEVPYPDVTQVKGHNLSKGAKIAIGIAIGAGVALLILFVVIATADT